MFNILKKVFSPPDKQLEEFKQAFEGKLLVEVLKTKINRHKVFWVGRSKHDKREIRLGVEFTNGRKYFYDFNTFRTDPRISNYEVMTPKQADDLEKKIKEKR